MSKPTTKLTYLHDCIVDEGQYWYLAGPYSGNEEYNFGEHERALVMLLGLRIWTYSPIVHCHAFANKYKVRTDAKFWQIYNETMIRQSYGIIVYKLPKWEQSKGTLAEISYANTLGIPVEELTLSDVQ